MVSPHGFGILDYCIFALTIAMSLGIGLYSALKGRKQDNTTEFLVAGRNMKVIPVALSLLVSFESSIMMLGVPGDVYAYGFSFAFAGFMMGVGICLAGVFFVPLFHNLRVVSAYEVVPVALSLLVSFESSIMMLGVPGDVYTYGFSFAFAAFMVGVGICVSGIFFVPLFHNLRVVSAFEYVQGRFGSRLVRLMACSLGLLKTLFYMGIVLYGPATALEAVSGFSYWYSLLVVAVAAMFYTSLVRLRVTHG